MPTYKITNKRDIQNPRVVDAQNPAAARAHVASDELAVERIDVSTAFKLASAGVKLETAGEEAAPPQQQQQGGGSEQEDD